MIERGSVHEPDEELLSAEDAIADADRVAFLLRWDPQTDHSIARLSDTEQHGIARMLTNTNNKAGDDELND
jgi:hypothetical protein